MPHDLVSVRHDDDHEPDAALEWEGKTAVCEGPVEVRPADA